MVDGLANRYRHICVSIRIPADSFLTEMSAERYVAWLKLLVQGNQNMIRVWGGGIFEPDIFYDTCDGRRYSNRVAMLLRTEIELGIMVWQDFMCACGQYPAHGDFLALVRTEAEQAVIRLRHNPSLVIYGRPRVNYYRPDSPLHNALLLPFDYFDFSGK